MDSNNPINRTDIIGILKNKDKMEKEKATVKPTVLNDTLIKRYIINYNKENKIFDKNDDPVWTLTHLALQFKNILQISNLAAMENLVKLQLDNNIINKIEKLDNLVNLQWLDLSFNRITKIEGLENLVQLEDLSLSDNKISVIEGLDNLSNLNVFSFGNNLVSDHEEAVKYLRGLKNKLQALKMSGNNWQYVGQTEQDYTYYTIEMLSGLQYIDYQLIDEEMRKTAFIKYGEALNELKANQEAAEKKDDNDEVDEQMKEAHIDCTVKLLSKILEADEDAQKLKILSRFSDMWATFDDAVQEPTIQFQGFMKMSHKKKMNIVLFCTRSMADKEFEADRQSIAKLDELKAKKKHAYRQLDEAEDKMMQIDDVEQDLINAVDGCENHLMEIEMILQDALFSAFADFKDKLSAINSQLKEKTNEFVKVVLEGADEFNKEFFPYACKEQIDFIEDFTAKQEQGVEFDDDEEFNDKLVVLGEKDDLIQMLEQSKDFIEKKIQDKETVINKNINEEFKNTTLGIDKHQKQRNRGIIKDIITTCNDYRTEIRNEFNNMRDDAEAD